MWHGGKIDGIIRRITLPYLLGGNTLAASWYRPHLRVVVGDSGEPFMVRALNNSVGGGVLMEF